jgi:hypothetical protein
MGSQLLFVTYHGNCLSCGDGSQKCRAFGQVFRLHCFRLEFDCQIGLCEITDVRLMQCYSSKRTCINLLCLSEQQSILVDIKLLKD